MDQSNQTNASSLWEKYKEVKKYTNVAVRFRRGELGYYNSEILAQIKFFSSLEESCAEFPSESGFPIMLDYDKSKKFINKTTFNCFYERLKIQYCRKFFGATNPIIMLSDALDQLNYIKLLDYLTFPNERGNLLDITWCDMFWIGLLASGIANLETFFDKKQLIQGYKICCQLIPLDSNEKISDLKKFFKIDDNDLKFSWLQNLNPKSAIRLAFENYTPETVTELTFGENYNQPL